MKTQFCEYCKGLRINLVAGDLLSLVALLFIGAIFVLRKARHEYLFPSRCKKCGSSITVYFMRSARAITTDWREDDEELNDWLVCKNTDCREAIPLP